MIFLNKTCYNGLYRVNSKGQFNTPIGRYKNPLICDKDNLREIHNYLNKYKDSIQILCNSYEQTVRKAGTDDIIYLDPPYDYEDDDGFTKYQMAGFTFENFCELKRESAEALNNGAIVIISNNATQRVLDLFNQDAAYKIFYDPEKIKTLRCINCVGSERKTGVEVIIWGMKSNVPFPQANDMDKIISLMMCDEETLADKEKLRDIIDVSSERQVSYYLCALVFLKYLKASKKFTDVAKEIHGNKKEIERHVFDTLISSKIFKYQLDYYKKNNKVDKDNLKTCMKNNGYKNLSEKTIDRRESTVKNWVAWMKKYEDEINSKREL